MADASFRQHWRWLFIPIALVALGWTAWLVWGSLPELWRNLPQLKIGWLLLVLLGNTISAYIGFEAFRALFDWMRPGAYRPWQLAHLYFIGQLMKHLPGRIWGVAYQSAAGDRVTLAQWVSVTAVYMLLSTGFALWVAAVVLGFMFGWRWGVLALVAGSVLYLFGWNARLLGALLRALTRLPLRAPARLVDAVWPFVDVEGAFRARVWMLFVTSWVIYLLAWAGYGMAWPGLGPADGIWLCALYTVAWFAGYISLVSPSGVGVRELVFVLLAHRFPPDAVAGMAVLGRVVLLCVDVLLGVIFIPFRESAK